MGTEARGSPRTRGSWTSAPADKALSWLLGKWEESSAGAEEGAPDGLWQAQEQAQQWGQESGRHMGRRLRLGAQSSLRGAASPGLPVSLEGAH